jgi:serine/threonine protein kinase
MRPAMPLQNAGAREVNTKFKVVKVVGKGSYGTVYQVQRLSDGETYALKEMDVRAMNQVSDLKRIVGG